MAIPTLNHFKEYQGLVVPRETLKQTFWEEDYLDLFKYLYNVKMPTRFTRNNRLYPEEWCPYSVLRAYILRKWMN